MPSSNPHLLKLEDFDKYQWIAVIDQVELKQCRNYTQEFRAKAEAYQIAGDKIGQAVFQFLSSITSIVILLKN